MGKDPEGRDWKIDKFISKLIAINPNKKPPSYEEVGEIIDKWDNMGRHITYPAAGTLWNQVKWQEERNARKALEKSSPEEW